MRHGKKIALQALALWRQILMVLIPIILLPLLFFEDVQDINLMFLGTLIMAVAIEHSHLHQRIALKTLCLLGTGIKMLVFGLMFISMFLSIWINNVAITAMMMPVVNSLAHELLQERRRSLSLGNIDVEGLADVVRQFIC
ncbi:hypothetical protein HPB52_010735 [Rhipicephalus sanguineus]|uniref:Citrate transporter-like domain-containing protein n=1 Tax=Rhipicephalus sanguineus TaxID=34632 RepID=A0A9D4T9E7_RHISA|nr:hypothetical protein HPB52_010735 [Rhipicephalus sanguineus]